MSEIISKIGSNSGNIEYKEYTASSVTVGANTNALILTLSDIDYTKVVSLFGTAKTSMANQYFFLFRIPKLRNRNKSFDK